MISVVSWLTAGTFISAAAFGQTIAPAFEAAAIIKDGPFYTRQRYHDNYPKAIVKEADFIYNHSLYVSPDHIVPRGITYRHNAKRKWFETKVLDARLIFEMPQGVEVVGLRQGEGLAPGTIVRPEVREFAEAGKTWKRYELRPSNITNAPERTAVHMLYFKATIPTGSVSQGRYYLRWKGGQQKPQRIRIEAITIPKVRPPKKFFVGIWHMETADVRLMFPNFPEDFTSIGLNTISLYYVGHWQDNTERLKEFYEFGDPVYQAARKAGLFVFYNNFFPWAPKSQYGMISWVSGDSDARARDIDGKEVPGWTRYTPCPSYRGKYYQEAIGRLKTFSQLKRWPASFFNMDMEIYGSGARGQRICFCPRCVALFEKWFKKKYPKLKYIEPVTLNKEVKRPKPGSKDQTVVTKYPRYYEAWVDFKIEQYSDMFKGFRQAIAEAIGDVRTASFDQVTLADWGAIYPTTLQRESELYGPYTMKDCIQLYAVGAYGPAGLIYRQGFEKFVDLYYRQFGIRRSMYDSSPTSGYGWSGPGIATKPERTKYYLLETAMNGLQGMLLYTYNGFEGKQMAINATVFDSFRLVDDLITEGERINDLKVAGKEMHARGFKIGDERLVLVGDNYVATDRREAVLTCPVAKKTEVYDILKREKLGELDPAKPQITLVIKGLDDRARFLYVGGRWAERLKR